MWPQRGHFVQCSSGLSGGRAKKHAGQKGRSCETIRTRILRRAETAKGRLYEGLSRTVDLAGPAKSGAVGS